MADEGKANIRATLNTQISIIRIILLAGIISPPVKYVILC